MYDEAWYLCEVREHVADDKPEPDWSKVPEAKRADVRQRWLDNQHRSTHEVSARVLLWGPQISFFERQPDTSRITVIEKVERTHGQA